MRAICACPSYSSFIAPGSPVTLIAVTNSGNPCVPPSGPLRSDVEAIQKIPPKRCTQKPGNAGLDDLGRAGLWWKSYQEASTMTAKKATARIRCAINGRVSTEHQTTENQECELIERAERAGSVAIFRRGPHEGARMVR